jgi:hypothetical protein
VRLGLGLSTDEENSLKSKLEPGEVFDTRPVADFFFTVNKALLPAEADERKNGIVNQDRANGTVEIRLSALF